MSGICPKLMDFTFHHQVRFSSYCTVHCTESVFVNSVGNLSPAMGARNQVGIGLSYRPASLSSLATQFPTRFLESIPRPVAGLKFPLQESIPPAYVTWRAGASERFVCHTGQPGREFISGLLKRFTNTGSASHF